jgi:hypothetical protein
MQPRTASANYSAGITLLWQGVCTPGYQSLSNNQFWLQSIFSGPCLVDRFQPVVIKTQALLVEKAHKQVNVLVGVGLLGNPFAVELDRGEQEQIRHHDLCP